MFPLNYTARWERNCFCQVKAKHRSIVPTVFSLLASVVDHELSLMSDRVTTKAHSMEGTRRKTPEIGDRDEISPISSDSSQTFKFSNGIYSCGKSHRTEDIFMREDEDGVLSHFCPLNKELDGERDENEDYPDRAMELDYVEWIRRGSSLRSDEIPFLMAEPPTNSDDNSVSNIDSSTPMIYPLVQNRESVTEDKDLQYLLQNRKSKPSLLDEKIITAWSEDSSDESVYCPDDEKDEELLEKYAVGNESDMEEFKEMDDEEFNKNKSEPLDNVENDPNGIFKEPLKDRLENEEGKNSQNEQSEEGDDSNSKHVRGNGHGIKSHKTLDENEKGSGRDKKVKNMPNECDELCTFQSSDIQEDIDSALKAEVKNAILITAAKLDADTQEAFKNCLRDIAARNVDVGIHKSETSIRDLNELSGNKIGDDLREENVPPIKDESEGKSDSEINAFGKIEINKDETVDCCPNLEMGAIQKQPEETQQRNNISMEPVAMNSPKIEEEQSDLKTALRFMNEVYPKDDDLSLDSLSDMNVTLKASVKEKPAMTRSAFKDIRDEISTPSKPQSDFDPALAEETRVETRPRNKLTKFFKSFKKKLGKKT